MILSLALALAVSQPVYAGGGCCMSKAEPATQEAATTDADSEVGCSDAAKEKSGCCADKKAAKKEGCCQDTAGAHCNYLPGAYPMPRTSVGIRAGAAGESLRGTAYTTYGFSIRRALNRRLSVGVVVDHTRLAGRDSIFSAGAVGRVRLVGHCLALFAEGGPTLRQAMAPNGEGGRNTSFTSAGYTGALGLSVCSGFGTRTELTYGVEAPFSKNCGPGMCGDRLKVARLGFSKYF